MTDDEREDLRQRFEAVGVPELRRIQIINQARRQARGERQVYRVAVRLINQHHTGVQMEIPWGIGRQRG